MVSGLLSLGASIMDWDWFFQAQNTRWLVTKIGRNPARLVYGILGFALILMSVFFLYASSKESI